MPQIRVDNSAYRVWVYRTAVISKMNKLDMVEVTLTQVDVKIERKIAGH